MDARTYEYKESIHIADTGLQEAARAISLPQTGVARIMRQQMLETRGAWDPTASSASSTSGAGEYEDPINVRTRAIAQAAIERGSSTSNRPINSQNFPGISAPSFNDDVSIDELLRGRRHPRLLGSPEAAPAARRSAGNHNSSERSRAIEARESRMREILAQLPSLPRNLRPPAGATTTSHSQIHQAAAAANGGAGMVPTRLPTVTLRSVNPWDTFSTDDISTASASASASYTHASRAPRSPPDDRLAHLRAMRDEALRASDEMDADEEEVEDLYDDDEDMDMEDDERYHREILEAAREEEEADEAMFPEDRRGRLADLDHQEADEWCPVFPDEEGDQHRYANLFGHTRQQLDSDSRVTPSSGDARGSSRGGQALALPSSSSSWPSFPTTADDPSFSIPASSRSPLTVSQLLNSLSADSGAVQQQNHISAPGGGGWSSITGLDWDPTGRWLYTSMERVVLEWEVNEAGRKCLPSAGFL